MEYSYLFLINTEILHAVLRLSRECDRPQRARLPVEQSLPIIILH